jgi:hypothetical protein
VLVRDGLSHEATARMRALEERLIREPLPENVRLTCFYSREDAIVHWEACFDNDPRTTCHEVRGTHVGLAWNARVYSLAGRSLLQPSRSMPRAAGQGLRAAG